MQIISIEILTDVLKSEMKSCADYKERMALYRLASRLLLNDKLIALAQLLELPEPNINVNFN